ncbi:hypothetical protein EOPP23_02065 [Endozoicomonas sp. OPT23]|uniref:outer membrane protein n=1 Tax=Endozoicomonas sp. OPT23 TaxID=2072845 RepID=UPI00129B9C6C|nr:outer membrane beta-barrel protein [Endozoicomonas sp. OPT23]MRI31781.1 hypothetical protein [Endozoicomonas sp. OPT23]
MKLITPTKRNAVYTAALLSVVGFYTSKLPASDILAGEKYLKLHGGVGWYSEGKDKTLSYGNGNFDRFSASSRDENGFQYGVSAGIKLPVEDGALGIGIGFYGQSEHDYKGYIDQYGKGSLRDFNYKFSIMSYRLMLEGSFEIPIQEQFKGFVTGGVGAAWNKFSSYEYSRISPSERSPKPDFKNETKTAFAWQLGGGVEYEFTPELSASVYYLYVNNGKAESKAENAPFSQKYETDDLTAHNLMFSLNYRF